MGGAALLRLERTMTRIPQLGTLALVALASALVPLTAQPAVGNSVWPAVKTVPIASGFQAPVRVVAAPDGSGRMFVVEKAGRIRILRPDGSIVSTPFLDLRTRVLSRGGEQGLLGLAFPPDYGTSGVFYVMYTRGMGSGETVLSRFQVSPANPLRALRTSERILWRQRQPATNHNGGHIAFGPDGRLWIGMGDGGGSGDPNNRAQDPTSRFGKLLTANVSPSATSVSPAIWASGLRNPWAYAFDTVAGLLFVADVGQHAVEEVNAVPYAVAAGTHNFGWNVMEGSQCYPATTSCDPAGFVLPAAEYPHSAGCSVTGGSVYRGTRFPSLQGIYFYGDFCTGKIWGLRQGTGGWETTLLVDTDLRISAFGVAADGTILVVDYRGGVHQLVPA
jgi:glucose/arabinose dehydrogenase